MNYRRKIPPDIKKVIFDWEHIFDRHSEWGSIAKQSGIKDIFVGLTTEEEIKQVVTAAYQNNTSYTKSQNQPNRYFIRGQHGTWEIEMCYNSETKIVETAYPIK